MMCRGTPAGHDLARLQVPHYRRAHAHSNVQLCTHVDRPERLCEQPFGCNCHSTLIADRMLVSAITQTRVHVAQVLPFHVNSLARTNHLHLPNSPIQFGLPQISMDMIDIRDATQIGLLYLPHWEEEWVIHMYSYTSIGSWELEIGRAHV